MAAGGKLTSLLSWSITHVRRDDGNKDSYKNRCENKLQILLDLQVRYLCDWSPVSAEDRSQSSGLPEEQGSAAAGGSGSTPPRWGSGS